MSNLEKSSRLLQDWADMHSVDMDMYHVARKLLEAELLAPDLRIIRTLEELEELGSGAWLMSITDGCWDDVAMIQGDWIHDYGLDNNDIFPLVVLATGAQVRAACEAMEEENE